MSRSGRTGYVKVSVIKLPYLGVGPLYATGFAPDPAWFTQLSSSPIGISVKRPIQWEGHLREGAGDDCPHNVAFRHVVSTRNFTRDNSVYAHKKVTPACESGRHELA
jgi:hypothetical protein